MIILFFKDKLPYGHLALAFRLFRTPDLSRPFGRSLLYGLFDSVQSSESAGVLLGPVEEEARED
jgi:hypothetical protein